MGLINPYRRDCYVCLQSGESPCDELEEGSCTGGCSENIYQSRGWCSYCENTGFLRFLNSYC